VSAIGHYDPSFYGVTVHLRTPDHVDSFTNYVNSETVAAWASQLGDTSLAKLAPLSAFEHEVRHFHDALLSPFGCNLMGMRLSVLINATQVLWAIHDTPGTYVPTPMARWLQWDTSARQHWVEETGSGFGIDNPTEIVTLPWLDLGTSCNVDPVSDPTPFSIWVAVDAESQLRIACSRRPSPLGIGDVSSNDAFECTAHIVQAQAIWQGQGAAATNEYFSHLLTANLDYLMPLRYVWLALERHQQVPFERLSAIFTWALLTPPEPGSEDDPARRLNELIELAAVEPERLLTDVGVEDRWDDLDDRLSHASWRDNLMRADAMAGRRAQAYARMRASPARDLLEPVLDIADAWLADRAQVLAAFRADPQSYVSPWQYVNAKPEAWPFPPIQMRFGDRAHVRKAPLRSRSARAITSDDAELEVIAYIMSTRAELLDASFDYAIRAAIVNHVFFEMAASDLTDRAMRHWAGIMTGKTLMTVY
jgi:hypothetical protein